MKLNGFTFPYISARCHRFPGLTYEQVAEKLRAEEDAKSLVASAIPDLGPEPAPEPEPAKCNDCSEILPNRGWMMLGICKACEDKRDAERRRIEWENRPL